MNVHGLDRVVIVVADMDAAIAFYSGVLGIPMTELPGSDADGCRAGRKC